MNGGLLGNKIGMTKIFNHLEHNIPVTILKVGPCVVTKIKTKKQDGYNAVQIGYGTILNKNLTQPQLGYLQKLNIQALKYLKEFPKQENYNFEVGQVLKANFFSVGQFINVKGKTVGKGFSGLQKRHNFACGPMTHGSKNHRAPGSIGMGTTPGRVLPGKKMSGQLGNKFITIKNLEIIQVNEEENLIIVKGSIPGKPGNLVYLYPAK